MSTLVNENECQAGRQMEKKNTLIENVNQGINLGARVQNSKVKELQLTIELRECSPCVDCI